jgi:hypothetical protein
VSIARISQVEHGEVTSFEVIARYAETLGGRLDLSQPTSATGPCGLSVTTPQPPPHDNCVILASHRSRGVAITQPPISRNQAVADSDRHAPLLHVLSGPGVSD